MSPATPLLPVFVYGTLRPERANWHVIEPHGRSVVGPGRQAVDEDHPGANPEALDSAAHREVRRAKDVVAVDLRGLRGFFRVVIKI